MKTCSRCKETKNLNNFTTDNSRKDKLGIYCRQCLSIMSKKYRMLHNRKEYYKKYYIKNKDLILNYQKNNRKQISLHEKKRKGIDIQYKLRCVLRIRLYMARKNRQKVGSAIKDLGCSIEFFMNYLESKFQDGMSWENYGKWHIDHIKPLSSFDLTNKEDLKLACNYRNLQPLWAKENLRKGNKGDNNGTNRPSEMV